MKTNKPHTIEFEIQFLNSRLESEHIKLLAPSEDDAVRVMQQSVRRCVKILNITEGKSYG